MIKLALITIIILVLGILLTAMLWELYIWIVSKLGGNND